MCRGLKDGSFRHDLGRVQCNQLRSGCVYSSLLSSGEVLARPPFVPLVSVMIWWDGRVGQGNFTFCRSVSCFSIVGEGGFVSCGAQCRCSCRRAPKTVGIVRRTLGTHRT